MSTAAIPRAKTREWPSYHGHATPLRNDPFATGEEFVRALHHRLCQPLTALSCALELMQLGREQDQKLTEQIQAAQMQSEKIAEMMGQFRLLFEASAPVEERHAVSLNEVLREIVEEIAPLADLQRVRLQLACGDGDAIIDISQHSLRQALWGLIQNCVEANPGKGVVTITRHQALVMISDSFGGSEVEDSFDPFSYTVNRASGRHLSNLPLAVAKSLIHSAGGEMTVGASPGGRCFTLKFVPARMASL